MTLFRPFSCFRPLPRPTPRGAGLLAGATVLLVTCVSGLALYLLGLRALRAEVRGNLVHSAQTISTLVNGDAHKQFTRRAQENGVAYVRAITPLKRVLAVRPDVKFIYTCVLVRGKVFFVLDPTEPGDHDRDGVDDKSHIFQPYPDATPAMVRALRTGRPGADDKPYRDEWGTFLSGYAPVRDAKGHLVAALGVDLAADEYLARIAKMRTAAGFGLALAFVLSAALGAAVYRLEKSALAARTAQARSAERLRRQNDALVELARGRTGAAPDNDEDQASALFSLRRITEAAARTLDVERVSVWLYTDEQASAIRCVNLFERGPARHSEGSVLAERDFPAYFQAMHEERTIAAHDARTDGRTREFDRPYLRALGITSLLDAPIRLNGRMAGVVCHEQVGPPRCWEVEEENFAGSIADAVALVLEAGERRRAEHALRRAHDELEARVAERTGALARANDALREENAERRRAEETVRWQANHDSLTGLPNRVLFGDRLEQALARAGRTTGADGSGGAGGEHVAVLFLDLDRFKNVNDTLGHAAGDQLLTEVAARLETILEPEDTVARMGGDEFTLLLPRLAQPEDAARVARRILDVLSAPMTIARHELVVTGSIGVSVFPHDGRDVSSLLKHADVAMYRAKEQGRSGYHLYTQALNEAADRRFRLEADLRHVLDAPAMAGGGGENIGAHGLFLVYQPQVALASGAITGMEALVRWNHPAFGPVAPSEFVPLAEEMGLIAPLGQWVLNEACRQGAAWHAAGYSLQIAVNLSARQFRQKDLAGQVAQTLRETGLAPAFLDLELTETAIMNDAEAAVEALRALKRLGVCLSVDDFGTGYSSLSYLRRFPLDTLKVDRSFVGDISANFRDRSVVQAVIELAHALGMSVIAEGVETVAQRDCLRALGCDIMQGFLFSRPLPAPALGELLRAAPPAAFAAPAPRLRAA